MYSFFTRSLVLLDTLKLQSLYNLSEPVHNLSFQHKYPVVGQSLSNIHPFPLTNSSFKERRAFLISLSSPYQIHSKKALPEAMLFPYCFVPLTNYLIKFANLFKEIQ